MTVAYIAGPMSSIPDFNYPAFHAAAAKLRAAHPDWTVINPAENFGGDQTLPWETYLRTAVQQVATADVIYLLPGWEQSKGAHLERHMAQELGLEVVYLIGDEPLRHASSVDDYSDYGSTPPAVKESIAQEAHRIVHGARQQSYGHPASDFERTGRMWAAILGVPEVTAEQVGLCMIALKVSREVHRHSRDNLVDIAGYAQTLDLIAEARKP